MTNETLIKDEEFINKTVRPKTDWWQILSAFFLISGIMAIIIGQVLTLLIWITQQETVHFSLQSITNLLFYISLPLLFLGACCLDKMEEKRFKRKL